MSGNTNFPTALDDDVSLLDVTDGVTSIVASHHNNLREAVKVLEAKVGIYGSGAATSLDYRLGHPSLGHSHNGASGQGAPISPSAFVGLTHLLAWQYQGSMPSGASLGAPLVIGRSLSLQSVSVQMRRSPSGATAAIDINFGATSVWTASQGSRPIFAPGVNTFSNASPNLVTYPSGALITIDADKVGTNEPGSDVSITLIFRD